MKPATRVKLGKCLLIGSVVGMVVNVTLYVLKIIDSEALILVTLILSWLALTLTAADFLNTSDVSNKQ